MSRNSNIYLLGFMGVGKTTIGELLAKKLDRQFFDIDDLIEKSSGKPITKIFEENGDKHFRQLESDMLKSVSEKENAVISCGGGIMMKEENMALITESGRSVYLSASIEKLLERLGDSSERPLLNGLSTEEKEQKIRDTLASRLPNYLLADITIDTSDKTPEVIVNELVGKLNL